MIKANDIYDDCDGFTLVETLAAVFILSAVSIISLAIMSSFADANQLMTQKSDHLTDIEKARSYFRDDLLHIMRNRFASRQFDDEEERVILSMVRSNTELATVDRSRSSAETVEYLLQNEALIRRSYDRPNPTVDTSYRDYVLLKNIQEISFRFYDGNMWQSNWSNLNNIESTALPRAIEISWLLNDEATESTYQYINRFQLGAAQ